MRKIYIYGSDFWEFYNNQNEEVQKKIDWIFGYIERIPFISEKFLKHIEGTQGLYEIRVSIRSNIFRIMCFFDQGNFVIILSGFQKKSKKTPRSEIKRAIILKNNYFKDKYGK
ncbi:MAG: type II toxin-antitoxin system RelE/ParE family toxin [Saprospiraceae bacterium]